jgi:hypothetical protein
MSTFERFMGAFNWLVVMVVSLAAILWVGLPGTVIPENADAMAFQKRIVVEFVGDMMGQTTLAVVGAMFLFLNWLYVVKLVRKSRYQRAIRFQNPGGDVVVQLGAVEECLTREARQSEDVYNVKVRVFAGSDRRPITVVVIVELWDTANMPSVVERLQEKLKSRFMEILNLEEPVDVEVTLRRVVARADSRKKKPEPASPPSIESGFRGPEYPID